MKRLLLILAMIGATFFAPLAPASAAVNATDQPMISHVFTLSNGTTTPWFLGGTVDKRASDKGCRLSTFAITRNNSNYVLLLVSWADADKSSGVSVERSRGNTGRFPIAKTSYSDVPVQIWTSPHVSDARGRWLYVSIIYVDIRDGIERTAKAQVWASNP